MHLDVFIEEFKTYKSLLSDIKNEYEAAIRKHKSTISDLEPFRKQIVLTRYEAAKELDDFHERVNAEVAEYQSKIASLGQQVEEKHGQIVMHQGEITALKKEVVVKNEMAVQITAFQEQISELNAKIQQVELDRLHETDALKETIKELRRANDKAKTDLQNKTDECNSIIANSVPKSSLQEAMSRIKGLKEDLVDSRKEYEQSVCHLNMVHTVISMRW